MSVEVILGAQAALISRLVFLFHGRVCYEHEVIFASRESLISCILNSVWSSDFPKHVTQRMGAFLI